MIREETVGICRAMEELPQWLELQNEIFELVEEAADGLENNREREVEEKLVRINRLIETYNVSVPTPFLQRPPLTLDNLPDQRDLWL